MRRRKSRFFFAAPPRRRRASASHYAAGRAAHHRAKLAFEPLEPRCLLTALGYTGGTYTQNFDNLLNPVPAGATTVSASVLPTGWGLLEAGDNANTTLRVDDGSSTTGDTFLYGSMGSNERAFGSFATGSLTTNYGLVLVNNTSQTITSFTLLYTGEQWKDGSSAKAVQNVLQFSWAINATDFDTGNYTSVAALNFAAPQTAGNGVSGGSDITLDGNLPQNQVAVGGTTGVTVTVNWQPGQTLWLRWVDINDPGNDDGLAIDNVVFSTTASTDTPPTIVNNSGTVAEASTGNVITSSQLLATDAEQGAANLTYTLTSLSGHGTLSKSGTALGLGGTFTQADVDSGLITYSHDGSETTSDTFNFSVDDGAGGVTSGTFAMTITPVNDPPVNTVLGAQTVGQGTAFVFSSAYGNAVQTSDADAGTLPVQVTLSVGHGTLSLADDTNLTFVSGSDGLASMTFTGTLSDINTALAGLTYVPTAGYLGSDTLTISTDDLGHSGAGGPQTDTDTVALTVVSPPLVVLNEIEANPPGHATGANEYQYVELRGTPGASLNNVYFVEFDGNTSGNRGDAEFVVDLSGYTVGADGLVIIKSPTLGHSFDDPETTVVGNAQFDATDGALDKNTVSFYLFYSPTAPLVQGTDYDTNNDGTLDYLPSGSTVLDNVGWSDGDSGDIVYGGVALSQSQGTPDAATRIPGTLITSAAAWYNGDLYDIGNVDSQLLYDDTRTSTNMPLTPTVPSLTPGGANFSEPSVLTTSSGSSTYAVAGPAVPVDPALTLTDIDSPLLASATVQITGNYVSGQDVLSFTNTPNLTGVFNTMTGTLTITGSDTPAAYQAALRSVTYKNVSGNPSTLTRTISFTTFDGYSSSDTGTRSVSLAVAPTVLDVALLGSSWTTTYLAYLDTLGYGSMVVSDLGFALGSTGNSTDTLPWTDLDTINVLFSDDVNVSKDSLSLIGSGDTGVPSLPTIAGFRYNSTTHVATWTLSAPLEYNRDLVNLAAASITDDNGMELDGDGSVGTDDNVEFYVLPGDTANLQTVTITEARAVVLSAGLSVGDASYNYRQDLTGQGTIVVTASRQIVPLSGTAVDLLDDPTAPQHSTGNLVTGDDMVTDDDISAASANAPITPATPLSVTTTVTDLSANEERAAKSDAIALGSITPVAKLAAVAIAGADSSLAATSTPPPLSAATMVAGPLPQSSQHIRHLDLALTLRGTAEAMTPTAPRVNSPLKH